jgi:Tfp pilus assembly protein PilO
MNRASDRDTRLAALEAQMKDVLERQEIFAANLERINGSLAHVARMVLKLNRELGAQRQKYPV